MDVYFKCQLRRQWHGASQFIAAYLLEKDAVVGRLVKIKGYDLPLRVTDVLQQTMPAHFVEDNHLAYTELTSE